MKIIIFCFLIFLSQIFFAQGDIQITCSPGYRIYLDDQFIGVSKAEEDGKYISGIPAGNHKITVEKTGYQPKTFSVNVVSGKVIEIKVGTLEPEISIEQKGDVGSGKVELKVGSLLIQSAPVNCTIYFMGKEIEKTQPEVEISNIPVGNYNIKFVKRDKILQSEILIKENEVLKIKADFINSKIINITAEERARKEAEERARKEAEERAKREAEERKHLNMVYIRGDGFYMGCTEGDRECDSDEIPKHYVSVNSFWIDKYEVTVSDYRKCVQSGKCTEPDSGGNCNWNSGGENHPINCVDWKQAKAYCEWLGKRLPTEAEWEYAERGGRNDWKYPWGNDISHNNANYKGMEEKDQWEYTSPVGSFEPNGYGLYDMAGNVWEWVEDCWNGSYNGAPADGSAWLSGDCGLRVLRGGSWYNSPRYLRVSDRCRSNLFIRYHNNGFRCASTN